MTRRLALVLVLALPPLALASSFSVGAADLGAGAATVARCDTAFTVAYTTSGGNVTTVTVGDVADPGCEGGSLSLTVVDSSGTSIASGGPVTVPTDGDTVANSVAVSVAPQPAAESVAGVRVLIAGP